MGSAKEDKNTMGEKNLPFGSTLHVKRQTSLIETDGKPGPGRATLLCFTRNPSLDIPKAPEIEGMLWRKFRTVYLRTIDLYIRIVAAQRRGLWLLH